VQQLLPKELNSAGGDSDSGGWETQVLPLFFLLLYTAVPLVFMLSSYSSVPLFMSPAAKSMWVL
jgi:hypothetical protein